MPNKEIDIPGVNKAAGVTVIQSRDMPNQIDCKETGKTFVLVSTGTRTKTFLKVKVYALGLYMEKTALDKFLGAKGKAKIEEMAKNKTDLGDYLFNCIQHNKVPCRAVVSFCRGLEGKQFTDGMSESLGPEMKKMGKEKEFEAAKGQMETLLPKGEKISEFDCVLLELNAPAAGQLRITKNGKHLSTLDKNADALVDGINKLYFATTLVDDCKKNLGLTCAKLAPATATA